jgi:hypothetical protein
MFATDEFAGHGHGMWSEACFDFLNWERENIMFGNQDGEMRKTHRQGLLYLLKVTEFMSGMNLKDGELETLRWRLNQSWDYFYNRPSPRETADLDAWTGKLFPE